MAGRQRDFFVDDRGRILRVTIHPHEDAVVISVWDGERCTTTFRLAARDASRLATLLLGAAVGHSTRGVARNGEQTV